MKYPPYFFLIDDDNDDREIFAIALKGLPEKVDYSYAEDGQDAIKKLKQETGFIPDCIFLDLNMPGMDGLQCFKEIKKIDRLAASKIYIYSTSADQNMIETLLQLGVNGYLVKPSNVKLLTEMLGQLLASLNPHKVIHKI